MKLCLQCSEPVKSTKNSGQKFCSRTCYFANVSAQVEAVCELCKVQFTHYRSRGKVRYCSQDCRLEVSKKLFRTFEHAKGKNHWNWKGGVMKGRKERNLKVYKDWRKAVFERDNYTCVSCGERGGWKEADHIKAWIDYPELRYDVNNGRTMCRPCHIARTARQLSRRMKYGTV